MEYKLKNIDGLGIEEIDRLVETGARFKIFQSRISLIGISFRPLSAAFLIKSKEEFHSYRKKYNLKTILLGMWHLKGPLYVYQVVKANNNGALDVTEDIRLNLEHLNLENQKISIVEVHTLFAAIAKSEMKELKKALKDYLGKKRELEKVYAGRFINVKEYEEPPYVIGLSSRNKSEAIEEEIFNLIYKRFNRFVNFQVIWESDDHTLFEKLKEQGEVIIDR